MDAVGRSAKAGKILLLLTPWIFGPLSIQAHEHTGEIPTDAKLGTVSFPISCKSSVQGDFNHAVALLRSFWHSEAQRVFEKVAAADSGVGRLCQCVGPCIAGAQSGQER
jgi:hypothetical protein